MEMKRSEVHIGMMLHPSGAYEWQSSSEKNQFSNEINAHSLHICRCIVINIHESVCVCVCECVYVCVCTTILSLHCH